mgnify:CR=1 FL=1
MSPKWGAYVWFMNRKTLSPLVQLISQIMQNQWNIFDGDTNRACLLNQEVSPGYWYDGIIDSRLITKKTICLTFNTGITSHRIEIDF